VVRIPKMRPFSKIPASSADMAFVRLRLADENGFSLLSVLLVTTVISALALGAAVIARVHLRAADAELRIIAARALADAGLTRVVAALETPGDPLLASLRVSSRPWSYANTEVRLELEHEAGKVDLNVGEQELTQSVMRAVVRESSRADHIVKRWMEFRRQGREIETVASLLDPEERFEVIAADLERHFTTASGARGIDPMSAPLLVLSHVPGISAADLSRIASMQRGMIDKDELAAIRRRYQPLLDGERPLYRIRSTVSLPRQLIVRREALVAQDVFTGKVRVIFWRDHVEPRASAMPSE